MRARLQPSEQLLFVEVIKMAFDDRTERPMEKNPLVDDPGPVAENHRELAIEPVKAFGRITSHAKAFEIHLGELTHRPLAATTGGTKIPLLGFDVIRFAAAFSPVMQVAEVLGRLG